MELGASPEACRFLSRQVAHMHDRTLARRDRSTSLAQVRKLWPNARAHEDVVIFCNAELQDLAVAPELLSLWEGVGGACSAN